jgi:tRNA-dihydrouridine synthase A
MLEKKIDRRLCVAPMMDYTDRHLRYLLRLLSPHALLYTEMVTTGTLLHGDRERHLAFNAEEHPVALQLGGSDPQELALCARYGADYGYDEINLNVGCPSDRVQNNRFGACLMAEPELVADAVRAMCEAVNIPVTVKTRLGIDERDSYEELCQFIGTVAAAGCHVFILHARKALLKGLSPKENREIPPLQHDRVYLIKRDFPELTIILNGGVKTVADMRAHLRHVDGVMIGRAACDDTYLLARIEEEIFGGPPVLAREEIARRYALYADAQVALGANEHYVLRHLLGLYQGVSGARHWRRRLSTRDQKWPNCMAAVDAALSQLQAA